MTFSTLLLSRIQNTPVLLDAEGVQFHKLDKDVFELTLGGQSFLFSLDAGIDLSFRMAEFLAKLEEERGAHIP